jgi:hypothetical protein
VFIFGYKTRCEQLKNVKWQQILVHITVLKHVNELGLKRKLARKREVSNVDYGEMQIIGENLVLQLEAWIKRTVQILLRSAENRILKSISKM